MAVEPPPLPPASDGAGPAAPRRDRRFAIALLLAGVACMGMGQTVVFAVLPPLGRQLGLADFQVAAIFMISALVWAPLSPVWGRQSDRFGRKPFILLGLSGFVVSMLLFAGAIRLGLTGALGGAALYVLIVCTRSVYGLIGSATPAAAQGYIADRTTPAERTAGVAGFSAAFGVGAMLGPGVGGAVGAIGPLAPLYAVAGIAAAIVAAIFFLLPEKTAPVERRPRARLKLSDPRLRPFLLFGLAFGIINAAPIQVAGFYFIDTLGLDERDAPRFIGAGLMAMAMASLFSQLVLVQRFRLPPHMLMRAAPALILAGHGLIAASGQFGPLVFGLVLSGLGAGMAIPGFTAASSLAVGPDEQGAAAGLANAAGASGFIVAPALAFSLYAIAPPLTFVMTAAMAGGLLAFALTSRAVRQAGAAT